MTHRRENKAFDQVLEVLIKNGMEGIASALEIVFNEAMKLERADFLRAGSYERTAERRGYSNREDEKRLKRMIDVYRGKAPALARWAEENTPEGFTVFELPASHRRRLRTTNCIERVNQEIKRRTRVARLFPNEESLLRLVREWETGRTYLNMKVEWPAKKSIYRKDVA